MRSGRKIYDVMCSDEESSWSVARCSTRARAEEYAAKLREAMCNCRSTSSIADLISVVERVVDEQFDGVDVCRSVWAVYSDGTLVEIDKATIVVDASINFDYSFCPELYRGNNHLSGMSQLPAADDARYHAIIHYSPTAKFDDICVRRAITNMVELADREADGDHLYDELFYDYEFNEKWNESWPEAGMLPKHRY